MKTNILSLLKRLMHHLVVILFPSWCVYCKKLLDGNDFAEVCLGCREKLRASLLTQQVCHSCGHPLQRRRCPYCLVSGTLFHFKTCQAAFLNKDFVQQFFYDYKFRRRRSYIPILSDLLLSHARESLSLWDAYVPVTLHRRDLFKREFCPVLAVTKRLSKEMKIPIIKAISRLPKKKRTKAQHQKTALERQDIAASLRPNKRFASRIHGKRILLIDDIFTSGSTLNAYSYLLKTSMKPEEIAAFVFLRTPVLSKKALQARLSKKGTSLKTKEKNSHI